MQHNTEFTQSSFPSCKILSRSSVVFYPSIPNHLTKWRSSPTSFISCLQLWNLLL